MGKKKGKGKGKKKGKGSGEREKEFAPETPSRPAAEPAAPQKKIEKEVEVETPSGNLTEEEAATKIQSAVRGKKAKKRAAAKRKKAKKLAKKKAKALKQAEEKAYEDALQDPSKLFEEGKGAYVRADGKRGCTDILFLLLFIAYWIGQVFLCSFSILNGDMDRLIKPRDIDGNSCGMLNEQDGGPTVDLSNFPALYLPNPALPEQYQICVKECPGTGSDGICTGNVTGCSADTPDCNYDPVLLTGGALTSGALGGALSTVAGACDVCPGRHTRETACVQDGDCSNGEKGVSEAQCAGLGDCLQTGARKSTENECLYDNDLNPTGNNWTAYLWTPYTWTYNEQDDGLMICTPPGTAGAPSHPAYTFVNGRPTFDFPTAALRDWVSPDGPCWVPVFESADVVFRCIPMLLADFASTGPAEGGLSSGSAAQYFQDIVDYWFVIPAGAIFAILAAFAWIIFLSKFAGHLIWFTVYAIEILLPIAGGICLYQGGFVESPVAVPPEIQAKLDEAEAKGLDEGGITIPYYEVAVGCFIAWGVFGAIFCIFKARIEISIGVIEEASDAFLDVPLCVFFPLVSLGLSVPVSLFCIIACFLLLSLRGQDPITGLPTYPDITLNYGDFVIAGNSTELGLGLIPDPIPLRALLFYQVFGWLWTCWFISSIQFTSISGAVATWYFTPEDDHGHKHLSHFLISGSIFRVLKHHLGTMAFGSWMVAVVQVGKFAAVYAVQQIQAQSPENKMIQLLGNCLKVAIGCVERFVRFLGHLAYIETAIYGTNFCRSILKAFARLVKNIIRFVFVTVFAKLVLFLGKVLVILASIYCSMIAMEIAPRETEDGKSTGLPASTSIPIAPLALTGVGGGLISFAVMGVYETAIDTIMMCFLEDEAENDDNHLFTFASGPLKKFMSGTRSVADAAAAYSDSVRDAKTAKIRADAESEKAILEGAHGVKDGGKGKRGKERKAKKKDKKTKKKQAKKESKDEGDEV